MENTWEKLQDALLAYWNSFIEAIPGIALAILIVAIGLLVARWITSIFRRQLMARAHDPLMGRFIAQAIKTALIVVVILFALRAAGLGGIAAGLLTAAGASAVVLGFAFKDIGENFLAGIILAFNRPFEMGDTIMVNDLMGKVKGLDFRYTHIKTFDGRDVYVPNGDVLNESVINYTRDGFIRQHFVVGIAYEDNPEQAIQLIMQALEKDEEIVHDEEHQNFATIDELAASTVNIVVHFWVETEDYRRAALEIRGHVIQRIKQQLESNGFNLPADIRELKWYGVGGAFPVQMSGKENGQQSQNKPQSAERDGNRR